MLRRSLEALVAKATFFQKYNDIDVYVEDRSAETRKLVARLMSRALGGEVRIECVFPLGPKSAVLAACLADNTKAKRKRVYIVDGDFDSIVFSWAKLPRLFVLPRYCIENFLVDENAASKLLAACSVTMDQAAARGALAFGDWVRDNSSPLRRLYERYIVAKIMRPSMRTVSSPLRELLSDDSGIVDAAKVEARARVVEDQLIAEFGREEFNFWHEFVKGRCECDDNTFFLRYVSGKDVLLPLLKLRMHKIERISRDWGVLKIDLADGADAEDLRQVQKIAAY